MIFQIHQNLRKQGKKYTIIYFPTKKEIDDYSRNKGIRKPLENRFGENLIFVTDDEYAMVSANGGLKNNPFDANYLLSLTFSPINIPDENTW